MTDTGPEVVPDVAIAIEQLVKIYPGADEPSLNGLELKVFSGKAFGLLGPNGAGKTTTISILSTLLRPTSGKVSVLGHEVVKEADTIRHKIGLVPQDIALYPSLTARENLDYFARILRVPAGKVGERIGHCLELVGLTSYGNRRISAYSGGMKRRTNLAVALLHEPAVLLLDEPTVGIDAQSRNLILERLAELKEGGMTLFYTTHYMEEAQQLCDEVAIIDGGKVVAQGVPQAMVQQAGDCDNLEDLFLSMTGKKLRD